MAKRIMNEPKTVANHSLNSKEVSTFGNQETLFARNFNSATAQAENTRLTIVKT